MTKVLRQSKPFKYHLREMPLLWCMMIDYCPNKVKRHTGTEYNRKTMGCLVFQRAHARIELCINFDTSKLKVINNFDISTLIMGINNYSEVLQYHKDSNNIEDIGWG
jgi:hypothetical protein